MVSTADSTRSAIAVAGVILALACSGLAVAADGAPGARGADAYDAGDPRVEAELLIDAAAVRPGQTVRVAVLFEMDPGWHIYWRNAGESGLPTELTWDVDGARVGPIRWPAPEVFQESDGFLTTYGYEDRVLLTSEAVIAPGPPGRLRAAVVADFVTCHVGCIPGRIELVREIPVSDAGRPAPRATTALFDAWAKRVPQPAEALGIALTASYSQSAVRPGDAFHAALELRCVEPERGCAGLRLAEREAHRAFVPDLLPGIEIGAVGHELVGDRGFALVLAGQASADDPGALEQQLRGLVPVATAGGGVQRVLLEASLPRAAREAMVVGTESPRWSVRGGFALDPGFGLLQAFLLALLGGLVLNLMPCVLPVLAIKIFHVAELAHASRRTVLGHGVAYTAGVLASMAALAAVVVGLRAAGTAVGWGFQFQEPVFVAAICTLLVVFAMNLFGVFEVTFQPAGAARLGAAATGLRRSFFEGGLAVVLATPCTAPFLGTAVGFAFAGSTAVVFGIFLGIGLGLAAPYAVVTLVPAWARIVPRPGRWMVTVRRGLGFSLVATAVWLLWVIGRSSGVDAQAALLGFLVLVAFATWVFGLVQRSPSSLAVIGTGMGVAALAVVGLAALPLAPAPDGLAPATARADAAWRPYDPAAVGEALAGGRPVFVDFTADWCITCKVNESVVLSDARVVSELGRLEVATFKADWTRYDEEIRRVLASFGRAGVPMYLVYDPARPSDPVVLPELLSVDLVLEALRDAAGGAGAQVGLEPARPSKPQEERSKT